MLFKRVTILMAAVVLAGTAFADGYRITLGNKPDDIPLVVVKGTPYEMGLAEGTLLKAEIPGLMQCFLGLAQQGDPQKYGNEKLDAAWNAIKPYTSERFVQELHGIADGSGVAFETLLRAHMIPVVSEYACSGVAAWGSATQNGDLYQFRNLDYTMDAHLQDYPAVVIYLPDQGIPHINVSFAGAIGSNTGMNANGIVLTEMGDSPSSDYPFNLDGVHFTTMFRDILYDAHNLDEAVGIVKNAHRIKKYHYIIGDGTTKKAVKMLAHAPDLVIWTDNDPKDEVAPNILKDVVYNCESRDPIGFAYLKNYYGAYDMDSMIQLSKAVGTRHGNLLDAVYDATSLDVYVSYANGDECAYRRPYVEINMKDYLDFSKIPQGAKVFKAEK